MKSTIIGVDLAKDVIQVCVVTGDKVITNKELPAQEFASWLASMKKAIVVFEACGTSNYWKQVALEYGHDARLLSAKLVARIRQHQKTDKNDALAIVQPTFRIYNLIKKYFIMLSFKDKSRARWQVI